MDERENLLDESFSDQEKSSEKNETPVEIPEPPSLRWPDFRVVPRLQPVISQAKA